MLRRDLANRDDIKRLVDARVLHLIQKGYADKDTPGKKYNIYTIDYGMYVDLLTTSKAPDGFIQKVLDELEDSELIVPFDDKRTIRRIIVNQELLDSSEPFVDIR